MYYLLNLCLYKTYHVWSAPWFSCSSGLALLCCSSHLDVLTSGIPNCTFLPAGTTENLYSFCLSLCIIVTRHTSSWGMHELLYVCNTTLLLANYAIFVYGKSILNILTGIRLPSLLAFTLYSNMMFFLLLLVSRLIAMMECTLLKLQELIVTMFMALCISLSYPFQDSSSLWCDSWIGFCFPFYLSHFLSLDELLHTCLKWMAFPQLEHILL